MKSESSAAGDDVDPLCPICQLRLKNGCVCTREPRYVPGSLGFERTLRQTRHELRTASAVHSAAEAAVARIERELWGAGWRL